MTFFVLVGWVSLCPIFRSWWTLIAHFRTSVERKRLFVGSKQNDLGKTSFGEKSRWTCSWERKLGGHNTIRRAQVGAISQSQQPQQQSWQVINNGKEQSEFKAWEGPRIFNVSGVVLIVVIINIDVIIMFSSSSAPSYFDFLMFIPSSWKCMWAT